MIIKPDIFSNSAVKSLQTTRFGGSSEKPYESLNLGVFGLDKNACKNLEILKTQQNLPHLPMFLEQVHSSKVVELYQPPKKHGFAIADAVFTRKPNVICSILSADCLPVLITDTHYTVVAAVHCGWRGLHREILKQTLKKLDVQACDLLCWLGPCISYKPYQVDESFRQKFVNQDSQMVHCFYRNKKGGWHADLKKIAVTQLESLGVTSITQSPYCTYDNKNLFFSYRRDAETGRMASLIWLNKH